MTACDRLLGLASPRKLPSRRSGRERRLGLIVGLLLATASCSPELAAPFVQLTLTGLPASVVQIGVDVRLGAVSKTPTPLFQGDATSLSQVTLSFPPESRGTLTLAVVAKDATPCVIATGVTTLELTGVQVYPLTIPMTQVNSCQGPKVPLTVVLSGDGPGTITSNDGAINCGTQCVTQVSPGSLVVLNAQPATSPVGVMYKFVGWSGGGCGTNPMCSLLPTQATTVTATFRCTGFCPETLAGQTNPLYAVWGFNGSAIVAVGANGTALQTDGVTWKSVASGVPAGTSLRAVHSFAASNTGYAVGDGGTIIKTTTAGSAWARLNSGETIALRGVAATSDVVVFAAGDNPVLSSPYLKSMDGSSWSRDMLGGVDYKWNAIIPVQPNLFLGVAAGGRSALVDYRPPSGATTLATSTTKDLNGVWVSSLANMFVVGDGGTILRSSGGAYSVMSAPSAGVNLHAIFGFSLTAIYAVGDRGTVWKYDGVMWSPVQTAGATVDLYGIWGSNESDFYMVGQNGTIIHKRM